MPSDSVLDFDTPITTMIWLTNGEGPVQLITYPREDLRVRLSDHKTALAEVGLEQEDAPMPYRWYLGRGDTLLLGRKGVTHANNFHVYMPHLLTANICLPPELRYTDKSLIRRAVIAMIWLKDDADPLQVVFYPCEDLRVRLSDNTVALAAVGFTQEDVKYPERHIREDGVGVWRPFAWDTSLKISAAEDTLLIGAPDVEDHKDFRTHEPHMQRLV
ncbi:hypothetical protein DFH06DRAFT_1331397 [Mycena polygramma]|nr:hypothetical protein DFH06DRAFT_1331397 [Mycena polygramma]